MARGTTLTNMVTMLRGRVGDTLDPAHGKNKLQIYRDLLRQEQERLYHDFDWPFLDGKYDVLMQAGQRYYDIPVEPETIRAVEIKYGDSWVPLDYGISGAEYNLHDSDNDERSDPVMKWDYYIHPTNDALIDNEQFEVWPLPSTTDEVTIRFWGKRALPRFTQDADRAILDDLLIVLYAAAILTKDKQQSDKLFAEARDHYTRLKGRLKKKKRFTLGGESPQATLYKPGPVRVVLSDNS